MKNLFVVQFFAFVIELFIIVDGGFLVLLVLGNQIVHVGFSFSEFHFIHTFASIPMQESLSPEHSSKLLRDPLEELLNCSRVSDKSRSHLKTSGRDVTYSGLNVVGNPLNKVGRVFILDVEHLLINPM